MQLIVLNYEEGCVDIIKNIPSNIEDIENFVCNTLGYKDTVVNYMVVTDDYRTSYYTYNMKTRRKIYDNENFINNDYVHEDG